MIEFHVIKFAQKTVITQTFVEEQEFNNKRRKLVVYPKRWRKKGNDKFRYQSKDQEGLSADSVREHVNEHATCGMSELLSLDICIFWESCTREFLLGCLIKKPESMSFEEGRASKVK